MNVQSYRKIKINLKMKMVVLIPIMIKMDFQISGTSVLIKLRIEMVGKMAMAVQRKTMMKMASMIRKMIVLTTQKP